MKLHTRTHRIVAVAVLASLAIGAAAPAAWAGHGRGRPKYRRAGHTVRVVHVHRSNSFAPAFAGFIGGLALGAAIGNANAQERHSGDAREADEYYYWDPYCRVRYASLDGYGCHVRRGCDHPHRVRVIELSSGECVRTLGYRHGEWRDCDDDGGRWEGRDRGRGCDDRYDDGAYGDDEDWGGRDDGWGR